MCIRDRRDPQVALEPVPATLVAFHHGQRAGLGRGQLVVGVDVPVHDLHVHVLGPQAAQGAERPDAERVADLGRVGHPGGFHVVDVQLRPALADCLLYTSRCV